MADSTIADGKDVQDDHGDITLDSDEIDSDGVLDDDDKSQNDILDRLDDAEDVELALDESKDPKPTKGVKRKIAVDESVKNKDSKTENTVTAPKKVVLNRSISSTGATETATPKVVTEKNDNNKIKITQDMDAKTRLEMRAKRFGLPVKMSDTQKKEARKNRFGETASSTTNAIGSTVSEDLDKLKKRADRFGTSVSKLMTDIDNAEKLEKRKAKFGTVK